MQEDPGSIPGQEDPLDKEMATRSSILAWEIPWTEEPGGLQPMGSQRAGHHLRTKQQQLTYWSGSLVTLAIKLSYSAVLLQRGESAAF